MKLLILAIGKKKSEYDPMIEEYRKRVVAPFSLALEILEPLGIDNADACRAKESEKLLSKITKGDYVVALDEKGKDLTTVAFSKMVDAQLNESAKRMVFVIGGAYGLDDSLKKQANAIVRLGSLTLPHEIARLVIAEQLYRATNFLSGGKYHHE